MVGRFTPTKIIRVRNMDKPWFDDQCRHAFGIKQEAHLRWIRDRSRVNWKFSFNLKFLLNFHSYFFSMIDIKIFTDQGCGQVASRERYLFRKIRKSQEQYPF